MCGASSEQKQLEKEQADFYAQTTAQAAEVFGKANAVFGEITAATAPIVAAGPSQEGYSAEEKQVLNSQAISSTAGSYDNLSKALNAKIAANGGGSSVSSGAELQQREQLGVSAANQLSNQELGITSASYDQGNKNYNSALTALELAPGVFNTTANVNNAATGAGSAASTSANNITNANNSWVSSVTGALGGIAGNAITQVGQNWGTCWIAEAIYGTYSPDTYMMRYWLNKVWVEESLFGRAIMRLYTLVGRDVAPLVYKYKIVRGLLKPIFDFGLRKAKLYFKANFKVGKD
jgi:hypothetical protein